MSGAATGSVRHVLRVEALCVLIAALIVYQKVGSGWGTFALFFFAPDLSFIGYATNKNVGAITYNLAHSYVGGILCLVAGFVFSEPRLLSAGIIWCAHVGFDRALGYGLKYAEGFGHTHLGLIGRARRPASIQAVDASK